MAAAGLGYPASRPALARLARIRAVLAARLWLGQSQAPDTRLDDIVGAFFATRIFGPERAQLLAAQLPATDAAAHREQETAALQARIKRIETAQNSCVLELEQLPADPADTASAALRATLIESAAWRMRGVTLK